MHQIWSVFLLFEFQEFSALSEKILKNNDKYRRLLSIDKNNVSLY